MSAVTSTANCSFQLRFPQGELPLQAVVSVGCGDSIAELLLNGTWPFPECHLLLYAMMNRSSVVLDLGAHLGTFSLPAGHLAGRLIAVDGSAQNVELLRLSAERNDFSHFEVIQAVIWDDTATIPFLEGGAFGRVMHAESHEASRELRAMSVDQLLEERGIERVDIVKMDIEGCEVRAFCGMKQLIARCMPTIVFESNGHWLRSAGTSVQGLLSTALSFGYELYWPRGGVLFRVNENQVQPGTSIDYVALAPGGAPIPGWHKADAVPDELVIAEALTESTHPGHNERMHLYRTLVSAPESIRNHPAVVALMTPLKERLSSEGADVSN